MSNNFKHYMVECISGRQYHFEAEDVPEVLQIVADDYPDETVECIYLEVYFAGDNEENDGQPDEMQEWHDFDPDC
jgi:hypothetical protein